MNKMDRSRRVAHNYEMQKLVKQINIQCDDETYPNHYDKTINELTFDLFILMDEYFGDQ